MLFSPQFEGRKITIYFSLKYIEILYTHHDTCQRLYEKILPELTQFPKLTYFSFVPQKELT